MQQISPPLRIRARSRLVLFGAVWFIALRPKRHERRRPRPSRAPGVQGLANSVAKARGAKEAASRPPSRAPSRPSPDADGRRDRCGGQVASRQHDRPRPPAREGRARRGAVAAPAARRDARRARRSRARRRQGRRPALPQQLGRQRSTTPASCAASTSADGRVVTRVDEHLSTIGNYAIFTANTTGQPGADDLRDRSEAPREDHRRLHQHRRGRPGRRRRARQEQRSRSLRQGRGVGRCSRPLATESPSPAVTRA